MQDIQTEAHEQALKDCGGLIKTGTKGMIYNGSKNKFLSIAKYIMESDDRTILRRLAQLCRQRELELIHQEKYQEYLMIANKLKQ